MVNVDRRRKISGVMGKRKNQEESWEYPSLDWIHRVRREMQVQRKGKAPRVLTRAQAKKLAKKYGLTLVRRPSMSR
jgi:hypothetical protein